MPRRPQGQWRPTALIACAVHITKIATSEIKETHEAPRRPSPAADSRRAREVGKARAVCVKRERLRRFDAAGAAARWR